MHIRSAIEQLGYSPHEVKVYLAALELGGSTATDIAEKARIPRTTVNLTIDSLHRKGLLDAYLQRRRKVWTAANPERLLIRMREQEAALKTVLPELKSLQLWDELVALLGKSFMEDFIEKRIQQHMRVQLLTPQTKMSLALKQKDAEELRITQFLPDSITINNSNFIYGNKVAIISLKTKHPVGILIEDKDIHHTIEVLFESLWQQSGGV